MEISLVVAMDENGLIGAHGGMPWHLPSDLRHFKKTTLGKPIFMGRRTHESIGKALPGRENLVLSRNAAYQAVGCRVVTSFEQVCDSMRNCAEEIAVIGGAQVYALTLPLAHRIYLTRIHDRFEGDTWFPEFNREEWQQIDCKRQPADDKNTHAHSFIELQRRG